MEHVSQLARHFRDQGHECHVLAPCSREDPRLLPPGTICVTRAIVSVPYSGSIARISLSPRLYRRVKKILNREGYDVIHLHEPIAPALPYVVLRHSKSLNVGTFHGYRDSHRAYALTKPIIGNLIVEQLHGRVAVSQAVVDYVSRYFPGEYRIIPNGVDVEHFGNPEVRPLPELSGGFNVLFVGRLEKRKGFKVLVRAFPLIKQAIPEARLIAVGGFGKEEARPHRRYVRRLGLADVRLVGFVTREELARYYRSAHLLCAPATGFESFGLILLEAMASGTPVVASDIPGYRTVLEPGAQGLFVPREDERRLAEAVIALYRDPARREAMGRAGQLRARQYDWGIVAGQVLDFYRELMARQQELLRQPPAVRPQHRWI